MDDLELIEEFRSDVQPPSADRVASARTMLVEQLVAGSRSRPRFRPRPAIVALAGAPAAVSAAVVLAGGLGGGGTSVADAAIIRHADAALTAPPNKILHTDVVGGGFEAESWQLTSAPFSVLEFKGPVGSPQPEDAQDGSTSSYWDPSTNTIHIQPGATQQPFDNPLVAIRQALHRGDARVIGSTTVDGVATYAIQFSTKRGYNGGLVAYVNKSTYRPVLLSDPQRNGTIVRLRVTALEFLPANAANRRLLTLGYWHPTAAVVSDAPSTKPAPKK